MLRAALSYKKQTDEAAESAEKSAKSLWKQVDRSRILESWRLLAPALLRTIVTSQARAGAAAGPYVDEAIRVQGGDNPTLGQINPLGLVGSASDGRPLDTLLLSPAFSSIEALRRGATLSQAMSFGQAHARMIASTQVADAYRAASTIASTTRQVTAYVRAITPPSCSRCIILAGADQFWKTDFQRHPNCIPAGAVVSGPQFESATRRWYEGELVVLSTASGEKLSLTGNHPVLTGRGWVPANLLHEGDEVVRSTRPEGATPLVIPDHHEVPSLIEDVWGALSVDGFDRVPSTPEHFHGDGQNGEVDIADTNGTLWGRIQSPLHQEVQKELLSCALSASGGFGVEGMTEFLDLRDAAHASSPVRGGSLGLPRGWAHSLSSGKARFATIADRYSGRFETVLDEGSAHTVLLAEGQGADSGFVGGDDLVGRDVDSGVSRWDAPGAPFSVENRAGYASRGKNLADLLSGQVELDCVVELRRVGFSGHVYNLTSSEGWYSANNLIVSNCRCVSVPVTGDPRDDLITDPKDYFDSLSEAEQDRIFTKAGAAAIRDGADMARVVNARRKASGMSGAAEGQKRRLRTRNVFGEDLFTTAELSVTGSRGQKLVRLMPESIYARARDHTDAIRLLKAHGYIY